MKNKPRKTGLKRLATTAFVLMLCVASTWAQSQVQVTGKVTDHLGEPLIGVSIQEKGTTNGIVTDLDGNYSLNVTQGATLVFSYVGYTTQELPVTDGTLNVTMREDNELLDEVVVIGYGTTKAKNFTGSVDVIKMNESPIADIGLANASSLLRGRMSGVILGSETAEVGKSTSILVRGRKSIGSTDDNPLIILNGVIFSGELDDIDPTSIESVSVLKDATSLAAYGSKAAQGVIMVTTKKGKEGKPQVTFSTSHEFSKPTFKPKYFDGQGYIRYRNARAGNSDLTSTDFMTLLEKQNYEEGKETDWYDLATRTGYTQNYNMSFSGASERSNYYIGVGHSGQRGMTIGNDFMRNFVSLNLSSKIADWFELGADMNFAYSKSDGTPANLAFVRMSPYGSAYLPDGRWRKYIDASEMTAENPLWDTYNGVDRYYRRTNLKMGGFASIDIPWIEGLNFRFNGSYSIISTRDMNFTHESNAPSMLSNDIEGLGYSNDYYDLTQAKGSVANGRTVNWVMDYILSYSRQFGDHSVSASLVYTRDSMDSTEESFSGTGFTNAGNTVLGWHGLSDADVREVSAPTYIRHTNVGYLARAIYSYRDTYHLNASIRRDGSSVFGSDSKWGYFPAVGAAWTISNEKWLSDVKWLDNLKLKVSWGKNGAQTIAPYGTLSQVSMAKKGGIGFFYGGNVNYGQAISVLGNPELGWQTTTSWNAGFETDLWNRRIHFELNFYKSKTTDQIFERTIPIMTAGVSTQKATMGQVNNTGVEINATTVNIKRKDFTWTSDFIFSLNRNKLVDLYGDGKDDIQNNLFLGHPVDVIYNYKTEGIFQEGDYAGWPIFYTKDGEQTATPDANNKQILGYSDPNFRLNWANTFRYKGFQLYMIFTGLFGGGGYAMSENTYAYLVYSPVIHCNALDIPFWTKETPSNTYPSANYANPNNQYAVYNSYAHVRLQDLSLSYDLTPWVKKWGIHNAKITLAGHNLFYIAPHWKRGDPEVHQAGSTLSALGLPKSMTMSLNFSF